MRPETGARVRSVTSALTWWSGERLVARLIVLNAGLICFGLGVAFMARADLGLGPWSVLHDGIGKRTGLPLGTIDILVGVPVLAAWLPLGERPGPGTVLSAFVIGLATNVGLGLLQPLADPSLRAVAMLGGIAGVGFGSALYLSTGMGPGPRDGLMTGLCRRLGWPIAGVRTAIELSVLIGGAALGGAIGPGTLIYALAVGPLIAVYLRLLHKRRRNA